jgi:hypothetical protein
VRKNITTNPGHPGQARRKGERSVKLSQKLVGIAIGALVLSVFGGSGLALSMDSDGMIHPLLTGTEQVQKQINCGKLHDKEVTVHGKYYPTTGAILVDRIAEKK